MRGEKRDFNRLVALVQLGDLTTESLLPKFVEVFIEVIIPRILDGITETSCFGTGQVVDARAEVLVDLGWHRLGEEAIDEEDFVVGVTRAKLDLPYKLILASIGIDVILGGAVVDEVDWVARRIALFQNSSLAFERGNLREF